MGGEEQSEDIGKVIDGTKCQGWKEFYRGYR